jgi:hypothetical protein
MKQIDDWRGRTIDHWRDASLPMMTTSHHRLRDCGPFGVVGELGGLWSVKSA